MSRNAPVGGLPYVRPQQSFTMFGTLYLKDPQSIMTSVLAETATQPGYTKKQNERSVGNNGRLHALFWSGEWAVR